MTKPIAWIVLLVAGLQAHTHAGDTPADLPGFLDDRPMRAEVTLPGGGGPHTVAIELNVWGNIDSSEDRKFELSVESRPEFIKSARWRSSSTVVFKADETTRVIDLLVELDGSAHPEDVGGSGELTLLVSAKDPTVVPQHRRIVLVVSTQAIFVRKVMLGYDGKPSKWDEGLQNIDFEDTQVTCLDPAWMFTAFDIQTTLKLIGPEGDITRMQVHRDRNTPPKAPAKYATYLGHLPVPGEYRVMTKEERVEPDPSGRGERIVDGPKWIERGTFTMPRATVYFRGFVTQRCRAHGGHPGAMTINVGAASEGHVQLSVHDWWEYPNPNYEQGSTDPRKKSPWRYEGFEGRHVEEATFEIDFPAEIGLSSNLAASARFETTAQGKVYRSGGEEKTGDIRVNIPHHMVPVADAALIDWKVLGRHNRFGGIYSIRGATRGDSISSVQMKGQRHTEKLRLEFGREGRVEEEYNHLDGMGFPKKLPREHFATSGTLYFIRLDFQSYYAKYLTGFLVYGNEPGSYGGPNPPDPPMDSSEFGEVCAGGPSSGGSDDGSAVVDAATTPPAAAPLGDYAPAALPTDHPDVVRHIRDWIRLARPPENVKDGYDVRYTEWGILIGTTPTGVITATAAPDYAAGRPPEAVLWQIRTRLDSIDHCTLEEYVMAMLKSESITHCRGRYRPSQQAVPEQVNVADITGLTVAAARQRLDEQGLKPTIRGGSPAPTPERAFTVESQTPVASAAVSPGDEVIVVVHGEHRPAAQVPAVVGMTVVTARQRLSQSGLQARMIGGDPAPSTTHEYRVQSQDPAANAPIAAGQTVTLRVYGAIAVTSRTVPDISRMTVAAARRAIEDAGLLPVITAGPPAPQRTRMGEVHSQSPSAGASLGLGAAVTIRVWAAPRNEVVGGAPYLVVLTPLAIKPIREPTEGQKAKDYLRDLGIDEVRHEPQEKPLRIRISGAALARYPRAFFTPGQRYTLMIALNGRDHNSGEHISVSGPLFFDVVGVYDGEQDLLRAHPNLDAESGLFSGAQELQRYDSADGTTTARIEEETGRGTWTCGPWIEGWSDELRAQHLDMMREFAVLYDCFIATAVYGTYANASLDRLRHFRDEVLAQSTSGRRVIEWYYRVGPAAALAVRRNGANLEGIRGLLDRIGAVVATVNWQTPYGRPAARTINWALDVIIVRPHSGMRHFFSAFEPGTLIGGVRDDQP
jgi:beta-lactam-binding protein with PASTA domain